MKFNSTVSENYRGKDYSIYIIIAIVSAFIAAFFLNIFGMLLIALSKVLIKYWHVGLLVVLVIIFFRRRKKK